MRPCADAESPAVFRPFRLDSNRRQRDDRRHVCTGSWPPWPSIADGEGKPQTVPKAIHRIGRRKTR